MNARAWKLVGSAVALLLAGCAGGADRGASTPPADTTVQVVASVPESPNGFVNRVWEVRQSPQIATGQLYAFLSDGTLVITSAGQKPSLGTWSQGDSGLVMVEEGISYPVDVLEMTGDTFRIRMHNPGTPVEITFGPAPVPPAASPVPGSGSEGGRAGGSTPAVPTP
jgi:hypothetical protein